MSKNCFSESVLFEIYRSKLMSRISMYETLLYGDVAWQIMVMTRPGTSRYVKLHSLRQRLHGKLVASHMALSDFYRLSGFLFPC